MKFFEKALVDIQSVSMVMNFAHDAESLKRGIQSDEFRKHIKKNYGSLNKFVKHVIDRYGDRIGEKIKELERSRYKMAREMISSISVVLSPDAMSKITQFVNSHNPDILKEL